MLILGSTSPYRRELLLRLRLDFTVVAPGVDETPIAGETPRQLACRLAMAKARAVADLHGESIGKPLVHEVAVAQLRRMSGQEVIFQTAVAVVCKASGFAQIDLAPVRVPAGKVLLLGDNRGNSRDGRTFGFVDREHVLGRAVSVFARDGRFSLLAL